MKHNHHYPLVKLPACIELILMLLREELKSRKFFNTLHQVGIDDTYYQSNLASAVLAYLGFENISDDLFEFYDKLLDKHSKKNRTRWRLNNETGFSGLCRVDDQEKEIIGN